MPLVCVIVKRVLHRAATPTDFTLNYRIIPRYQAVAYLQQQGLTLRDVDSSLQIRSGFGRVYRLPTSEIVLLGAAQQEDYPAFVFASHADFDNSRTSDFFPIPRRNMSWMEAHARQVQGFLTHPESYGEPLRKVLGVHTPFHTAKDGEVAYQHVQNYLRSKAGTSSFDRADTTGYYGLAMARYLVQEKGYAYRLQKEYVVYNPYYEIVLTADNEGFPVNTGVLGASSEDRFRKQSFRDYYWTVAHVPTQDPLD